MIKLVTLENKCLIKDLEGNELVISIKDLHKYQYNSCIMNPRNLSTTSKKSLSTWERIKRWFSGKH